MKRLTIPILLLLFIVSLNLPQSYAQDYTRWDLPSGAKLRLGKGSVNDITYSSDGDRLIVVSSIGIWTYDSHTGIEIGFIAENPDNILGLSQDGSMYVSLDSNNSVIFRHLLDGRIVTTLTEDIEDIRNVVFSQDGKTLAGISNQNIHLWDLSTGAQKGTLLGHTESVRSVTFSPDSTTLASNGGDGTLQLWDVATATHIKTISRSAQSVYMLRFTPDGQTLVSQNGHKNIHVWDVVSGKVKSRIKTPSSLTMALSPDGNTIASGGFKGLHLWDVATGEQIAVLGGQTDSLRSIAFSPDGNTIASGEYDNLFLWDVESGERIKSITGHTDGMSGVTFTPDGNTLVSTSRSKVLLWDYTIGEYKKMIYGGHWTYYTDLNLHPDGNMLACADSLSLHLWDLYTATHIAALPNRQPGGRNTATGRFNSIAFSPDGTYLLAASNDKTIHVLYLARTYVDSLVGHTDAVNSIAFSQDNHLLVSGSNDQTVRLWDFDNRSNIATFIGHTDKVLSVAVTPDARTVASGSEDNAIRIWDVATGNSFEIQTDHTRGTANLEFSPDAKTLLSCGSWGDPILQIWDVATGEQKKIITDHTGAVYDVDFSPDGKTLASASVDGTILLWDYQGLIDSNIETQELAADVNRDGTVNLQDLISVASYFGQTSNDNPADVNGDGIVDILDILFVAAALADENGAPSINPVSKDMISTETIQQWLKQAKQINTNGHALQKGITMLEGLLSELTPNKTVLLPNYPNPFNPETWIPYQLAMPSNVSLHIYSTDGHLVRSLQLGSQPAGNYYNRERAAYWDGKNEFGEQVASGVYFYTLTAGKYTATRRMLVCK